MISVEEALAEILAHARPLEAHPTPILEALGCVLAEDVVSDSDLPPFHNSAMDGYAVRAEDVAAARPEAPASLKVTGTLAAGGVPESLVGPMGALRIMTGAPLPEGADAVVPLEDTGDFARSKEERLALPAATIRVHKAVQAGANVRAAGEDIRLGELVLGSGRVIRPQEIGVLASLGRQVVRVHRRPRVAVLATGDELLEIHEPLAPGKIRNSNEYSTAALVMRTGGIPVCLGIARDTAEHLASKIRRGLAEGVDLFLTSGGVSVGDYDVVKDVLGTEGEMRFWQVRMKPGKPLAFGVLRGGVPLLGLPGNPVSAMVSFEQFARPLILRMLGHTCLKKPTVWAVADSPLPGGARRSFVRVVVTESKGEYRARVTGEQGSGVLTSMAKANGLAIVPEGVDGLAAGEPVEVQMLDWPEGVTG